MFFLRAAERDERENERDRVRERESEPDSIPRGAHCCHLWMLPRKQTNQASFMVKNLIPSKFLEHPEQIKADID